MLSSTELDQMAEKFGGRYKLTVLIQKRLKELVKGGQKLVDVEDRNLINVVIEEIRQGKSGPSPSRPSPAAASSSISSISTPSRTRPTSRSPTRPSSSSSAPRRPT
jgi:DNA-directed RNA polymerase subunit K/omega